MIPISAEPVATIAGFTITNTLVNSTLVMLCLVALAAYVRSHISDVPSRLQAFLETLLETMLEYGDRVTQDRAKTRKFLPIAGTAFIFILACNWFGLMPGTGSIGIWHMAEGKEELIPLFRSANSDLNLTLALAVTSVLLSHLIGMFSVGFFVHWNRFIQLGSLWKALKTLNPMKIMVAVVELGVGFIELFSEAAKVVSLSLRLFGNVFAGEVLLTVFASLLKVVLPVPFLFMELLVGVVQAMVFSMLTLVYLSIMSTAHGHEDEGHEKKHGHAETSVAHAT